MSDNPSLRLYQIELSMKFPKLFEMREVLARLTFEMSLVQNTGVQLRKL